MLQIDGFFLYQSGFQIHPVTEIRAEFQFEQSMMTLLIAHHALEDLLNKSVFKLQLSRMNGQKLLDVLKSLTADVNKTGPIGPYFAYLLTTAASNFETVLAAEMGMQNIWLVLKKRGYDTTDLIQNGWILFPEDLAGKVPDALPDVQQATKCIAFSLPTAAGFHLHRANESVVHSYYDVVTNGADRPKGRNLGDYIGKMQEMAVGDERVLAALREIKDLHRNPLIHPEHSLDSVDDAIALMGSIHSAITAMLKEIPYPQEVRQLEAGAE